MFTPGSGHIAGADRRPSRHGVPDRRRSPPRPFTVDDGRATGPGVFDMKAGIVQAIHALSLLDDLDGVELLITADEEVGSNTSRALIEERALACGAVLVLEPSADGGALKTGRKGTGTFEVIVHGRAAHAGLEPEKGINSLVAAAQLITRIATFGDPETGTTVTPTVATAGTADNVVPALTRVRVDARVAAAGREGARRAADVDAAPATCRVPASRSPAASTDRRCRSPPRRASSPLPDPPPPPVGLEELSRRRCRRRQRRQLHGSDRRADPRRPRCSGWWRPRRPRVRRWSTR